MDIFVEIAADIKAALTNLFPHFGAQDLEKIQVHLELPREKSFGDLSTNVALVNAKAFKTPPYQLAEALCSELMRNFGAKIATAEVVKPGFINLTLPSSYWHLVLKTIQAQGISFAQEDLSEGETVNIEYVSANPTGPMHVGHGRGAVIGSVLAKLYQFWGYQVTQEYYINDAGNQINVVANSLWYRYAQLVQIPCEAPEEFYPGEYLVEAAQALKAQYGLELTSLEPSQRTSTLRNFATFYMLDIIKADLQELGVKHDNFVSEEAISSPEAYAAVKAELFEKDLLYYGTLGKPKAEALKGSQPEDELPQGGPNQTENAPILSAAQTSQPEALPALSSNLTRQGGVGSNSSSMGAENLIFRSTRYGDDSDRVIEKTDGSRTYFANDIVYHKNKLDRKYGILIDLLGADHKGYKRRLESAVLALSGGQVGLVTVFTEMVNLFREGTAVRMSKRAGNFVTLRSVLDEISADAFRIIMLSRSSSTVIDFDLHSVYENTESNPVYYLQYAYVRVNSVLRNVEAVFPSFKEELTAPDLSLLTHPAELELIKQLAVCPKFLKTALLNNNVHLIYVLMMGIAKKLHTLWGVGTKDASLRFVQKNNKNLTFARLSLLIAAKSIMHGLFSLIGVSKPEKM